jgi:hypothetical protein
MTAFTDLRAQLAQTRTAKDAATAQLAAQCEQLKRVRRQRVVLQRLDGGTGSQLEPLAALQKQEESLSAQIAGQREQVAGLQMSASGLLGQLTGLADPTQQIAYLNDAIPILLFPVRLETRFRTVTNATGERSPQLWIRVYPDVCQVDAFETLLTETEVQNATSFWIGMWRAGGVEAQERGAWRSLVGGSGSGRAAYVIQQYAPTNPADKPTKAKPQDVVLVIVPQIVVSAAEQAAAFVYWTAVWKANGDATQEQAALTALGAAVGNARAEAMVAQFGADPNGWDPPKPYTRAEVTVSCAVLQLPPVPLTKASSWTQAAKAVALPDRFVALAFKNGVEVKRAFGNPIPDGLAVAPDPSLPAGQQIQLVNDDLQLNQDLRWLAEFPQAVAVGMGIEMDLPAEAQGGIDRLLVVGVRMSSDEYQSKVLLEALIAHQYATKGGYSLVPQGSPTNNTDAEAAAYTWVDDADASYDTVIKGKDAYVQSADPLQRRDGQWLAEALGIDDALVRRIPNAGRADQAEARAMNIALWNGTLGYAFEEMLSPLFSPADIAATRQFFTRYVSGRGPLPAVRVGQQPYGVLPAMAFSRYGSAPRVVAVARTLPAALPTADYLLRLQRVLLRMGADWWSMSRNVAHVGQAGDPHQTLLDIVGLHSGAVEYHQRYAESFDQLYNKLVLELGQTYGDLLAKWLAGRSKQVLTQLGGDPGAQPPILEKFFYGTSPLLSGPVVDDAPLSETKPIRAYTPDKKNYIEWLMTSSLDAIRRQDFGGNPEPTALLYLMLRHAMMLGEWDAGIRLLEAHGLVDPAVARAEPSFINVQTAAAGGQSKFQRLYEPQPAITGNDTTTLAEYVLSPLVLNGAAETEDLRAVIAALSVLADVPTARLERLFAEHVDCCSYRLDAWQTGIAATRLAEMRAPWGREGRRGIYLGAFGCLENLRPKPDRPAPVPLEGDVAKVFQRPGDAPLRYDPQNAGYIHAPSLSQAAAAAILKNAYRVNASPANPDAMAVNLSSRRVRQALALLEGVRNGQTLSALLGYRFERGLHDEHNLAEVDKFIYPLRQAFPLVANQLKSTQTDGTVDITLLEARNVIDGVKLVNRLRTPGKATYPFGLPTGTAPGQLPPATVQERAALDAEAGALLNLYDALGDLVMAETTYQVVLGNFDRASANTTAFSQGTHPPETHVVDIPRGGLSLTHRVGLHLDPAADPAVSPSAVPMTPRAQAEAPLNLWLAQRMPAPADVVVSVTYSTPALPAPKTMTLSQADLGLQPLDLIYLLNLDLDQAMSELDDRIVQAVRYGPNAHPDVAVTILYAQPVAGKITFFELAALVRSLRTLVLKSRAVGPTDMALPLEAKSEEAVWDDAELTARLNAAITGVTARRDALDALKVDASDLDAFAQKVSTELLRAALFGVPRTGTGQIHGDIRAIYDAIAAKVREVVARWNQKSADYATLLATWPTLTTDGERFALLRKAERLISSSTTPLPPADPNVYKSAIEAKKTLFDARLNQFQALLTFGGGKVVDFAAAAAAMTPLAAAHDATPFDIGDQQTALATLRDTIVARVTSIVDDLTQRITDATAAVAGLASIGSSEARVQQLLTAAKRVLGDEIQLIPRFKLSADRGAEFNNCWTGSVALLTDLKSSGRRFPVDDWFYGVARVREKLKAWENVAVLSEAFGAHEAELTALQLPFVANDRWTALEFDPSVAGPNSRLVYTAHFAHPFDPTGDQCGLLLDEWPELVPGTEVVSGVAFNFDRPNSQPPQVMLLALPSVLKGTWGWDDLVATLIETLEGAKARGVEPAQIDASGYAQFLPATLMAVTLYQVTIATNLALNNHIYDLIQG